MRRASFWRAGSEEVVGCGGAQLRSDAAVLLAKLHWHGLPSACKVPLAVAVAASFFLDSRWAEPPGQRPSCEMLPLSTFSTCPSHTCSFTVSRQMALACKAFVKPSSSWGSCVLNSLEVQAMRACHRLVSASRSWHCSTTPADWQSAEMVESGARIAKPSCAVRFCKVTVAATA